jgi:hypothetical protein
LHWYFKAVRVFPKQKQKRNVLLLQKEDGHTNKADAQKSGNDVLRHRQSRVKNRANGTGVASYVGYYPLETGVVERIDDFI